MKDLKQLKLKTRYRSATDNLLNDFYIPVLSTATKYQRAVAYFTSSILAHAASGVSALLENGGCLELIASPVLTEEDVEAINLGYASRDEKIRQILSNQLMPTESALVNSRLNALAWLVAENKLEVKLAFRTDKYGRIKLSNGIYHEKIGVIHDSHENYIAFDGSANESKGGLISNFESIPVHFSWDDPQDRALDIFKDFNNLWENKTPGLKILSFTEVASELLEQFKTTDRPSTKIEVSTESDDLVAPTININHSTDFTIPAMIELRPFQEEAIRSWIKNNGRGIVSHATGTGKSITALAAAARLRQAKRLSVLVIVCPQKNLVTQWSKDLRECNTDPIEAFTNRSTWHAQLTREALRPREHTDPLLAVVTTFATLGTPAFQELLSAFPKNETMLIADEAHHLGSRNLSERLPKNGFPFRLALSATPERWQDEEGTDRLIEWFGKVLEPQVGIPDAIEMGYLCPYYYHPIFVELDQEEAQRYQVLMDKILELLNAGKTVATDEQLARLINEKSRFIATVKGKINQLEQLIHRIPDLKRALVYCEGGSIDFNESEESSPVKQVDHVVDLLGNKLGVRVAKYTAETSAKNRKDLIDQLKNNQLQAIVAINCLDEGVNIPCIETAIILSSSQDPRQFVQRRGRVLRLSPGTTKKHAIIYDFIVLPTGNENPSSVEKKLMEREMSRYLEFAKTAINENEAMKIILPYLKRFNLLHL